MWLHPVLWLWIAVVPVTKAHIRLVFPPARQYDFDALDNMDSEGPCGMPRGKY